MRNRDRIIGAAIIVAVVAGVIVAVLARSIPTMRLPSQGATFELADGDWRDYDVSYTPPTDTNGPTWQATMIKHVRVGNNGGYPGNHTAWVATYDYTSWPNDPNLPLEWAVSVPKRHVQVAYWCSGEDTPSPTNKHWVVGETWPGTDMIDGKSFGVDFPIWPGNVCKVAVWDPERPGASAIVGNLHTNHPDEGEDVRVGHHSFQIWLEEFQPASVPTPTPMPTVTATSSPAIDEIRNTCWNRAYPLGGIPYNPAAGFPRIARERGLGVPVTREFDLGNVRVQGFSSGILWAVIGDWGNVREMEW